MEKKFRITVEGRQYIVTVEDITEAGSLILPDSGSMRVPTAVTPAASVTVPTPHLAAVEANPGDELSPLAGIIHTVDITVGQAVREGDKLVTLEAMKMITTVIAHRPGTVTQLFVKTGDVVEAGQRLLTIA
ncbi:MAG TPA: biotin/lipoyl-containing protein [Candidatus Competibacteraceae bacterium]|nr:biotin/lipoyl-containing protein [Candidatus Competibacteraceae bacterium]